MLPISFFPLNNITTLFSCVPNAQEIFMRLILILIILSALVSCGKKQANNLGSSVSMVVFEQKVFTTIRKGQDKSLIRSKLLNLIVEQTFPPETINPENTVNKHDELHKYVMSDSELNLYEEKEKEFSKVIVSYHDREEIYFLPERVPVINIISELELSAGVDRVFKRVLTDYEKTYKGGVVYLVSLNHRDLMKNDQKFYRAKSDINLVNHSTTIDNNKSAFLSIDYTVSLQKLVPKKFGGHIIKCTPELIEAGMCGLQCAYKKDVPSSEFEIVKEDKIEKLGFRIKYEDMLVNINDMQIMNKKEGYFEVKMDHQEALKDSYLVTIIQDDSEYYYKMTTGYDYTNMCSESERDVWKNETLSSKVNMVVTMHTFGRGAELLQIKL